VISGLVAAGGMAAAMSTADGLLLAMANALSHDLYYKIIDPKAETKKRLLTARILLLVIGAAGALVASLKLTGILGAVAWAFCFAMSGLFFPLVLGVWWKRANRPGAIAGMLVGLGAGWWYLLAVRNPEAWYGIAQPWIGLNDLRFGIVGITASLIAMVVVTLLTPAPDEETQRMVDEVRIPSGRDHPDEVTRCRPHCAGGHLRPGRGEATRPGFFLVRELARRTAGAPRRGLRSGWMIEGIPAVGGDRTTCSA
jgi:cation/acetate symporter